MQTENNNIQKKILFSAVQPSGIPTIANYIGSIKNWVDYMDDCNCIYSIADLHTLTVKQEPAELRKRTSELLALYLACGVDPQKCVLFVQSHVPMHAELTWILNTLTYPGELSRMTQYKSKCLAHADNINMGLMDYPVLMAADILLYGTDLVPVGADQKQHLEIARDLAIRFNNRYSPTFTVPEGLIPKVGARIKSLQDPDKKMSKSDENVNGFISMYDDKDTIIRKFKRAVTDSENEIRFDEENKAGISNLMTIYSVFTGKSMAEIESRFSGSGYGDFKIAVGEVVGDALLPIQMKKDEILKDKAYLNEIMKNGKEQAERIAGKMLAKVYRKVGLLQLDRN